MSFPRAAIITFVRLLTGVRARWLGVNPADVAQCVYFANHTSHLDAVALWAALPDGLRGRTRPVAARDYWMSGLVRPWLARHVLDAVLVERKNISTKNNPLAPMLDALDAGSSLIIFPEGTRNAGGGAEPGGFKSGIYHLARHRPKTGFIPVWIDNVNRALPKGEFLPVPMLGGLTMGAPLTLREDEDREAFLLRARDALLALRK
ncbi:1-acyl-sn-glycerol-3-phosphate acyltransferase [Termitidicoccus mucosus]|uniref:Phospholipid/glycerol acyltransferase domain-containing protein n=1 Tax=Termitidicoccus mucosus TaxID=1184151 RepID=A0A178IIQ2_9BACT|nr:hypothetical protein AW736_08875 [Opitutaceae bacterium TSB47]